MKLINFFDEADYFNVDSAIIDDRAKKSLRLMREIPNRPKKVLDVGCGTGFFTSKIKKVTGAEVYGIDISKKALKLARKHGIRTGLADLNKRFPFKDGEFDMVNCGEVIEHMYNPDNLLREINRVLKKGGYLVITTPNLASWLNRIALALGIQPFFTEVSTENKNLGHSFLRKFVDNGRPMGHLRVMTLNALKDILRHSGFRIIKVKGAYVPFRGIKYFDSIFSIFPSLSSVLVVLARKN